MKKKVEKSAYSSLFFMRMATLPELQPILDTLKSCNDEESLKAFFQEYLWKKGSINSLFKEVKSLSPEEKKEFGWKIKKLFDEVQTQFFAQQDSVKKQFREEKLQQEILDIGVPWVAWSIWHQNLQNKLRRKVENIFQSMWYNIEYGRQLVTTEQNFESVNIPKTHPATEMHDTLYVKSENNDLLLRTHTSAHQVELIKKYGPSCKFIIPGKVNRNEKLDASHDVVFWQIEWVLVDKGITFGHFKYAMKEILKAILETDSIELRMRPAYFPFVEPGVEIDAKAVIWWKEKRLEILWAWMIHPYVLENAGLDPKEYSGFAFGLGMTRLVAIKYGIWDIRLLTNWDLRFAHSFKNTLLTE